MRRIYVIALTVCSTLAVTAAAIAWEFEVVVTKSGVMLLPEAQAEECATGGGCDIFSVREIQNVVAGVLGLGGGRKPPQI